MKKLLLALFVFPFTVFAQQKKISFDEIYRLHTFAPESVPGFHSMKDGKFYTDYSGRNVRKNNFLTGLTIDTLIKEGDAKDESGISLPLDNIEWNSDEKKILIFTKSEKIYRYSSTAFVYAYDLQTKKTQKVDNEKVLHATYSPDGSKVAFVKNNNLYIKKDRKSVV